MTSVNFTQRQGIHPSEHVRHIQSAAEFIVKTANGLVQGYSYWTFSDIFEENYFPSVPFHGGFGLLDIHDIAKPAAVAPRVTIQRIDLNHANAKRHWEEMGDPEHLSATAVSALNAASLLFKEPQAFTQQDSSLRMAVPLPPQSVAAIELTF